jgi:hypothetical protein
MRHRLLPLAAALVLAACATAGPRVANNPCEDPAYRALKAQPVDSLSEREFKQLQQGDAACAQVQAVLATTANDAPRPHEVRVDTDGYTQAMQNELGSEIFIRNKGNVAIMVTSVTLTSCVGIRDVCGTSHPRVRINPGDARRVLRVRYQNEGLNGSFQYTYRVEPVDPGQN